MRRGTTPSHIFTTDIDLTDAEVIYITYKQVGKVIVEKTIDDLTLTAEEISCKLTQAETLDFEETHEVEIQIRARFADGSAVASNIMKVPAERILKDEVI